MRKIELEFFKESGKYYDTVEVEFDESEDMYEILQYLEFHEKRYAGMDIYLKFAEDDDIGFPVIIRANQRRYR